MLKKKVYRENYVKRESNFRKAEVSWAQITKDTEYFIMYIIMFSLKVFCQEMLAKLNIIDESALNSEDSLNVQMLKTYCTFCQEGLTYNGHFLAVNFWEGPDVYFYKYTVGRMKFETVRNYEDYIRRLQLYPKQVTFISTGSCSGMVSILHI